MKKIQYVLPIFILTFFISSTAFNSRSDINELTNKIISLLGNYVDDVPEEKVFLHLDKPLYAAGEDVWFSVYLTAGSPDIPSPLSKVVYVDLLDNDGVLLQQKTIQMEAGHGFGDFKLDNFTREGIYQIKAYTHWMRGFGEEAVFSQTIEVMEPYNLKFQPSVVFEKTANGDGVSYRAAISALNRSLQPLSGETLTYALLSKGKVIEEGNVVLDADGKNELTFQIPLSQLQGVVALSLSLLENAEYSISRKFLLPFPLQSIDLQFLPEGGDLIAGFNNKVAVRAIYPDGSPAILEGSLQAGQQEILWRTNERGLGSFEFNPLAGEKYTAKISAQEGVFSKDLPRVLEKGVNLSVDNSKEGLVNILIQAAGFNSISPSGEGLLVVHARGRIGHMQKIDLRNGVTGARINKSQLPPGINQITFFEPEGNPLAERLVFVPLDQTVKIALDEGKMETSPRAKNTWKLSLEGDNLEGGSYSIAVTDANELPYGSVSNIISYLKLESELKGNIHQAHDLLGQSHDDAGIDLIMLTHGWRRFNWDKLLAEQFDNANFIEQGINITGMVKPKTDGKRGLTGGNINVFSKGNQEDFMIVDFAENGKFIIDDLTIQDTTQLILTASDKRYKEFVEVSLDAPLAKYVTWEGFKPALRSFELNPSLRDYLTNAEKRRQASAAFDEMEAIDIDEFVVQSQKIDPEEEVISRVYGKGDRTIKPEDIGGLDGFSDVWQMLQGRVAGVQIKPSTMGGAPSITIRGTGSVSGVGPIFFLDNVPVEASLISTISPRDIAAIDVFKESASLAIFGSGGAGGAIAIYTKKGGGMQSLGEGVFNFRYPGYSTSREYYMPKYDTETIAKPDFRSTLYWNPKIKWEGNKASISFYNNDVVKKYKVIIQGMDNLGRLTYFEKIVTP
ncbi:TonB-dependent receptor plug domain-containing protein [Rhodonellum sp.]|uniref:TonB-dependent receptor plug domain-containing protein n=1 Tax=Rhodonellum sp. TaxID=2231180 RepID=UPI0027192CBC|nr:TonB-dependent receptor plug domain-containing protein [Rhodonellum sp.]MDO9552279.1 TonB-dependent receptor plug domain-containing protein [Rhodonellum sp.]